MTTLRIHASAVAVLALLVGSALPAQQPVVVMRYAGTIGQQRVSLTLDIAGESISGGRYLYASQKSEIRIVDSRRFGTTLVLQDEDGNILHLHFEDAAGEKTGSFETAVMLEGILDRDELELPVKLIRNAVQKQREAGQ